MAEEVPSPTESSDAVSSLRQEEVQDVLQKLMVIREDLVSDAAISKRRLDSVHANFRDSALNLMHYLALRRHDLRPLQIRLAALGLSSLGRAESHVLATVDSVLQVLHRLAGQAWEPPRSDERKMDFAIGSRRLAEHTESLLSSATSGRDVRIMVTMPTAAGQDYQLVHDLLRQGMNCMRINCAHDDPSTWSKMIEHLRRAENQTGQTCRIAMDLGGPKLRTGPLEPGPALVKIRPRRDSLGRVTAPARIWLTSLTNCQAQTVEADACLPVPANWLAHCRRGSHVTLTDARDSDRRFKIVDVTDRGCWAESRKTAYVVPGTILRHEKEISPTVDRSAAVGDVPAKAGFITLKPGDQLVLTRDCKTGRPASYDDNGQLLSPAVIGCTIPEIFDDVQAGDPIRFDDGKIDGIVESIESTQLFVRINRTPTGGAKLRSDKGINLPESRLHLAALTPKDLEDLAFVAQHADLVELSFANSASDVESLQQNLQRLGRHQLAIVLKIETRRGFENLPEMLLTAMRSPCCGVMIARGDLAVECGFERLAEVQEEILWICEAAHIPVIWATQVLENLATEGMPSRAEITDAAMSHRAECVMLNKGPQIVDAVRVLDNILRRMQEHQSKKRAMLRDLHLAHRLPNDFV